MDRAHLSLGLRALDLLERKGFEAEDHYLKSREA
jgi:hypothetical protein